MTFFAKENPDGENVDVLTTYGPIAITVVEAPGHLRSFHTQLGQILDKVEEKEKQAHG